MRLAALYIFLTMMASCSQSAESPRQSVEKSVEKSGDTTDDADEVETISEQNNVSEPGDQQAEQTPEKTLDEVLQAAEFDRSSALVIDKSREIVVQGTQRVFLEIRLPEKSMVGFDKISNIRGYNPSIQIVERNGSIKEIYGKGVYLAGKDPTFVILTPDGRTNGAVMVAMKRSEALETIDVGAKPLLTPGFHFFKFEADYPGYYKRDPNVAILRGGDGEYVKGEREKYHPDEFMQYLATGSYFLGMRIYSEQSEELLTGPVQ
jgi:hypothetical protein